MADESKTPTQLETEGLELKNAKLRLECLAIASRELNVPSLITEARKVLKEIGLNGD